MNTLINKVKKLGDVVFVFMLLYDVSLKNVPSIFSSRKVALIILLIYAFQKKITINYNDTKRIMKLFGINFLILLYVIFISYVNGSYGHSGSIIPRYVFFIIYTLFGSILLVNRYKDEYEFMDKVIAASMLQAIIVLLEFFSNQFKVFLNTYFVQTGNVSYLRDDRATGLGVEGAYLTLLLFVAIYFCCYFMVTRGVKAKYIVMIVILIGAMFTAGRTGLYTSALVIFVTLYKIMMEKGKQKQFLRLLFGIIALISVGLVVMSNVMTEEQFNRLFYRIVSSITNISEDGSIIQLGQQMQTVPPISVNTILGTGIFRGTIGTLSMQADGGYVQMYYALGLIASIVFYGALYGTMCRYLRTIKKSVNLTYFVMYALILVVVEIKEPFTFKYILPMLFFVIVMLYHKRICKETSDYDTKRKN